MKSPGRRTESYGSDRLQIGEWFIPAGNDPAPTVVLIHGGFWRKQYDRSLENDLANDLCDRGYLIWNIEYRSSAVAWPATLTDVAAAADHVLTGSQAHRVDRDRIAVVGHSAGGQLAAWLASRHRLTSGAPGFSSTPLRPALCVPQAGVVALTQAANVGLGGNAAQALCDGSPSDQPGRYAIADPIKLLPSGIRSVLIHGDSDDIVPPSQSQDYVQAATAVGDDSSLQLVAGDHFIHLDPTSEACARLRDALATMSASN